MLSMPSTCKSYILFAIHLCNAVRVTVSQEFYRFSKISWNDLGMLVRPRFPSKGGKQFGFSGFILNHCRNLVKKRNSSILARDCPIHDLGPIKIKQ